MATPDNKTRIELDTYSPNPTVKQSHDLVSAIYDLDMKQKRVLYLAIREAAKKSVTRSDGGSIICNVSVKDYAYFFDMSSQQASREISSALKTIGNKVVAFLNPDEDFEDSKGVDYVPFFSRTSIKPKRGVHSLFINPEIEPNIRGLSEKYTLLSLLEVSEFSNPYISRIYEHIRTHNLSKNGETGKVWINLQYMLNRFNMPKSYCDRMSDLRRRVLIPACKEITANTPFKLLDEDGQPTFVEKKIKGQTKPEKIEFNYTYCLDVKEDIVIDGALTILED